jgi:uncharacterized membrane protein AbrB (regulator of aidB expression)
MAYNSIFRKIRKHTLIVIAGVLAMITIIIGVGLFFIRHNEITANNKLGILAANDAKYV